MWPEQVSNPKPLALELDVVRNKKIFSRNKDSAVNDVLHVCDLSQYRAK